MLLGTVLAEKGATCRALEHALQHASLRTHQSMAGCRSQTDGLAHAQGKTDYILTDLLA